MAGKGKTHQRIFSILSFLNTETKPDEPINIKELQNYLGDECSQRQVIYNDLKQMELAGIGVTHDKNKHYYYNNKRFDDGELELLADVICSSSFLDVKNAEKLILHIKQMTNTENFDEITRQTNIYLRSKSLNPECIENIRLLHQAIGKNRIVEFDYESYNSMHHHIISPYILVWDNSQCYLIGGKKYKSKNQIRNFRVDRIYGLKVTETMSSPIDYNSPFYSKKTDSFDAEKYMRSIFFMYGSKDTKLTRIQFRISEDMKRVIIDRFGQDTHFIPDGDGYYTFNADIQETNMFYGWAASFTPDKLSIINPKQSRNNYIRHLKRIYESY